MLRLVTVFSGIGAIEQALLRTHVNHEIVFACDNGEQSPFVCKATEWNECVEEFKKLSAFVDAKFAANRYPGDRQRLFG